MPATLTLEITELGLAAVAVLTLAVITLAALTAYQHGHARGQEDAHEAQQPPYKRYRGP